MTLTSKAIVRYTHTHTHTHTLSIAHKLKAVNACHSKHKLLRSTTINCLPTSNNDAPATEHYGND